MVGLMLDGTKNHVPESSQKNRPEDTRILMRIVAKHEAVGYGTAHESA